MQLREQRQGATSASDAGEASGSPRGPSGLGGRPCLRWRSGPSPQVAGERARCARRSGGGDRETQRLARQWCAARARAVTGGVSEMAEQRKSGLADAAPVRGGLTAEHAGQGEGMRASTPAGLRDGETALACIGPRTPPVVTEPRGRVPGRAFGLMGVQRVAERANGNSAGGRAGRGGEQPVTEHVSSVRAPERARRAGELEPDLETGAGRERPTEQGHSWSQTRPGRACTVICPRNTLGGSFAGSSTTLAPAPGPARGPRPQPD